MLMCSQIPTPGGGPSSGAGAGPGPGSGVGGRMLEGGLCWASDELLAIVALYERPSPRSFTQLYLFAVACTPGGGGLGKTAAALALDSSAGVGSYLELVHQAELVDEAISAFSWSRAFIASVPDTRAYEERFVLDAAKFNG